MLAQEGKGQSTSAFPKREQAAPAAQGPGAVQNDESEAARIYGESSNFEFDAPLSVKRGALS